jgi:hypothetical protein
MSEDLKSQETIEDLESNKNPNKGPKLKLRKRPKGYAINNFCVPGPFEKKELLFEQLDHFQELQSFLIENRYKPIEHLDAAHYFGLSLFDFTQAITSSAFANYSMAITKIRAQQATRDLDKIAVKAYAHLAEKGLFKEFLTAYSKRLSDVGFIDVKTEELEELRRDEGTKLIEQLSEILTKLNGGKLPPIQRILPLVLGHSVSAETSVVDGTEDGGFDHPEDEMAGPARPDPVMGAPSGADRYDEGPAQAGNSGPGEPLG